ncbi:hypothetical protein Scep_012848 [Stephania cephalantha]|uniref:Uncharacterized protein n=1 Tax=Stephania cephalantha TaxID=152367 RepID=A0AAP0JHX7_9MAGN
MAFKIHLKLSRRRTSSNHTPRRGSIGPMTCHQRRCRCRADATVAPMPSSRHCHHHRCFATVAAPSPTASLRRHRRRRCAAGVAAGATAGRRPAVRPLLIAAPDRRCQTTLLLCRRPHQPHPPAGLLAVRHRRCRPPPLPAAETPPPLWNRATSRALPASSWPRLLAAIPGAVVAAASGSSSPELQPPPSAPPPSLSLGSPLLPLLSSLSLLFFSYPITLLSFSFFFKLKCVREIKRCGELSRHIKNIFIQYFPKKLCAPLPLPRPCYPLRRSPRLAPTPPPPQSPLPPNTPSSSKPPLPQHPFSTSSIAPLSSTHYRKPFLPLRLWLCPFLPPISHPPTHLAPHGVAALSFAFNHCIIDDIGTSFSSTPTRQTLLYNERNFVKPPRSPSRTNLPSPPPPNPRIGKKRKKKENKKWAHQ